MSRALLMLFCLNVAFTIFCVHSEPYIRLDESDWWVKSDPNEPPSASIHSLIYGSGVPPVILSGINLIVLACELRRKKISAPQE